MPPFDKATQLSILLKSSLSERSSSSLWEWNVSLFSELINVKSIFYYTFNEFIMLLSTFSSIFCSVQIMYDLPTFTWASVIDKCWSIWLGVKWVRH